MPDEPMELFSQIAEEIKNCKSCPLHETRIQAVPGDGGVSAKVVFIGEAPGKDEDEQGLPFVGRSGQLLRTTIEAVGFKKDEFFIGNVLKCRPPDNRDPLPAEIEACRHFLHAQLVLIKPKLIVTLGRYSLNLLIDPSLKITKIHGQHIKKDGQLYLPTFHPAMILRNARLKPDFERDLLKAKKLCEQL